MTKKQLIKKVKDVMDGTSAYTYALVEKTFTGWEIETSYCQLFPANQELNQRVFQHCCNRITLEEVEEELDKAFSFML